MKKCKYCQSEIDDKAKICPNCGKKQSHTTRNVILGAVALIIIISIATSGNKTVPTSSTNTNTNANANASLNDTQTKEYYNINEEAVLGDGSITVTKVEKSAGTEYEKPQAGKEYVIVSVNIKNNGSTDLSYNPYDFKLQNSDGQKLDESFYTGNNDTALNSGELAPSGHVSGTIAFEAPKNDSDLTLIYQDNIWSSKTLKIKLQ